MPLPSVPEPFYWSQEPFGAVLRCRPLDTLSVHLFTTRQLRLSSHDDWLRAAMAVNAAHLVTANQVHGRNVHVVRHAGDLPGGRPEADVLLSGDPRVAVAVRAADCVPLLLADRRTGCVAAVHAGWRGTAAGAAAAAVDSMKREFGSRPADLAAAVGPCIGSCCYEVGPDVVDVFAAAGHSRGLIDRWFVSVPPPRGSRGHTTLRLDVAAANRDQLILGGVPENRIYVAGICTAMHLDVLTSFRAEKESAGRIAGVIRPLRPSLHWPAGPPPG
jgi:YfiH family protein